MFKTEPQCSESDCSHTKLAADALVFLSPVMQKSRLSYFVPCVLFQEEYKYRLPHLCLTLSVSVTEGTVIILKAGNTAMHKKRTYPCKLRDTTTFPVAVLFDLIAYNCCKLGMGISCLPFLRKTDYLTATCVFLLGLKCVQSDATAGSRTKSEASVSRANAGLKQMTVECNSKLLMWSVV